MLSVVPLRPAEPPVEIEADVLHGTAKVATFAATCMSGSSEVWSSPELQRAEKAVA